MLMVLVYLGEKSSMRQQEFRARVYLWANQSPARGIAAWGAGQRAQVDCSRGAAGLWPICASVALAGIVATGAQAMAAGAGAIAAARR